MIFSTNRKKFLIIVIVVLLLLTNSNSVFAAQDSMSEIERRMSKAIVLYIGSSSAYVNSVYTEVEKSSSAVYPIVKNGRTLVPVRFIAESLGAVVNWDGNTKEVTIVQKEKNVSLVLGNKTICVNGVNFELDVPAQTINNRTFIPLRALVEALGKQVIYDRGLIIVTDEAKLIDLMNESDLIDDIIELLNPVGNTMGNLINRATVIEKDGWIYYFDDGLFKMKYDGSNKVKLTNDSGVNINLVRDRLYYISGDDNIYTIKVDGSERKKLTNDSVTDIIARGDWVYYVKRTGQANSAIYKIRNDGSNLTKITEDKRCFNLNLAGEWLYYVGQNDKLFMIKIDGTRKTQVPLEDKVFWADVQEDWIFYISLSDLGLYKVKSDGTNRLKLVDDLGSMNVKEEWVYYSNDTGLFRIGTDGKNETQLVEGMIMEIVLGDNWIYFYAITDESVWAKVRNDGSELIILNTSPLQG